MFKTACFLLSLAMLPVCAFADDFYLVLNGKSFHEGNRGYNESNNGVGFEWDFDSETHWRKFVAGSVFKDSNHQTSKYLGAGLKRRYLLDNEEDGWYSDVGVIAFLMTRYDRNDNDPFFGALPFVSVGNGPVSVNFTYIPRVSPKTVALFYVQAKVRLVQW